MSNKIGIILGTRPEIIKLSSVIRFCKLNKVKYFIIHTNQHYSKNMDEIFFKELNLPKAKYNLEVGSCSRIEMISRMMVGLEKVLLKEKPVVVFVQGDTNTVLAGALAASSLDIKIGHIEAGLRSYDRTMPEEINRIITDNLADYLFCPTSKQVFNLKNEGINKGKVFLTGNTIVDAVRECIKIADKQSIIMDSLGLSKKDFILMTSHRPSTVDSRRYLMAVILATKRLAQKYHKKVVFPIHPRTKKMLDKFKIAIPNEFIVIEPLGYIDMLKLQKESFLIITDSGGIQEESCILKKKCVIIRHNTERPEAIDVGGCVLAGNDDPKKIFNLACRLIDKRVAWINPFGQGKIGEKIIKITLKKF